MWLSMPTSGFVIVTIIIIIIISRILVLTTLGVTLQMLIRIMKMDFKIELGFINYNLIDKIIKLLIAAGLAVLLSILTFFSTPILEKIFGNGAVQVDHHHHSQLL